MGGVAKPVEQAVKSVTKPIEKAVSGGPVATTPAPATTAAPIAQTAPKPVAALQQQVADAGDELRKKRGRAANVLAGETMGSAAVGTKKLLGS